MHSSAANPSKPRQIYIILSPRSLPYARFGIQTLLLNSLEALDLALVTDTPEDCEALLRAADGWQNPQSHRIHVVVEDQLADVEASLFKRYPNVRSFRHGHPCWRKITDPLLISEAGEEIVILDPDLYFPNRFSFEPTPAEGLLLMWQKPNCLLPPEVVQSAVAAGIRLARHVDIGVAHWRAPADLDWLDWLIGRLGGSQVPRAMHVEAIVWAALAMREGGGYLDPHYWKCWERTPAKRILRKLGMSGCRILQPEPWPNLKCFHAGGEAKWWLAEMEEQGFAKSAAAHDKPGILRPFAELTPEEYDREEANKRRVRKLDVFHIFR